MSWNHRILATQINDEIFLNIHKVYYDKKGNPNGYAENPCSVGGENIKEITTDLYRMLKCRKKPILWGGDKFPKEYKPQIV